MRLTILGSGTNVHPTRAAAGYLVQTDQTLLLDLGPRTLMNLIRTGVDRHRLTHLLFSHFHADHFSDFITFSFDEVSYARHVAPRPDLTIIGPRGTRRLFHAILSSFPGFRQARFRVRLREAAEAGVGRLVLSHFYPVAERADVRRQAGRAFKGKIVLGKDLLSLKV